MPKGAPKAITSKLQAAGVKATSMPEFKKLMDTQGTEVVLRGPDEFRKIVKESMAKNAKVVQAVGLRAE